MGTRHNACTAWTSPPLEAWGTYQPTVRQSTRSVGPPVVSRFQIPYLRLNASRSDAQTAPHANRRQSMARYTDDDLKQKVQNGFIVEYPDEMTDGYRSALVIQLLVQADTELISAPAYFGAARDAPSTNTMVSATAIIQDELAHANIAYRLLEDLGLDKEQLVYGREPHEFKHPYGFDHSLDNWAELVVANGFYDRAGITLLGDVFRNTSYGPLKRALVKVDQEETFHLRHGEMWMKRLSAAGGEAREKIQRAVDWMFPMAVEWFGLPDSLKRHSGQLEYRLKGLTNDQLRQVWLSATVPLCESIGIAVPAHQTADGERYELDFPFPCEFDEREKRWLFDEGGVSWDRVFDRWKRRGPRNRDYVTAIQEGVVLRSKLHPG